MQLRADARRVSADELDEFATLTMSDGDDRSGSVHYHVVVDVGVGRGGESGEEVTQGVVLLVRGAPHPQVDVVGGGKAVGVVGESVHRSATGDAHVGVVEEEAVERVPGQLEQRPPSAQRDASSPV
jgi:hypothetical protein